MPANEPESPADKSAAQQTDQSAAQQTATPTIEDLQAQNKDLQAKITQHEQELARLRDETELLRPYVNFGAADAARTPPDYDPTDPDQVREYNLRQEIRQVESQANAKLKAMEFLADNADLKPYRDRVAWALANRTDPRKGIDARLRDAASVVRAEIKQIRDQALAEKEATEKAEAARRVESRGIMSGHEPSPPEESAEAGGESNEEYLAARQKQQNELLGGGPFK